MLVRLVTAAPWLTARLDRELLEDGESPAGLNLSLDGSLAVGEHTTTITLAGDGAEPVTLGVEVTIYAK